jgi:phosphate transport system substrate-binding protein
LGYFGYAYYVENHDKLKAVGIAPKDKTDAPVLPSDETIKTGTYSPLSRPLYLYVNKKAMQRPEVAAFLKFYLNEGQKLVHEVGYIQLNDAVLNESKAKLPASGK